MKKTLIILGSVFLGIILCGFIAFMIMKAIPVPVSEVAAIDLKSIEDGTYVGEHNEGQFVKVVVSVSVAGHKITEIVINKHENGLGSKAEIIVEDIIEKQSVDVDAVSGATVSSNAIRKAVEVALSK